MRSEWWRWSFSSFAMKEENVIDKHEWLNGKYDTTLWNIPEWPSCGCSTSLFVVNWTIISIMNVKNLSFCLAQTTKNRWKRKRLHVILLLLFFYPSCVSSNGQCGGVDVLFVSQDIGNPRVILLAQTNRWWINVRSFTIWSRIILRLIGLVVQFIFTCVLACFRFHPIFTLIAGPHFGPAKNSRIYGRATIAFRLHQFEAEKIFAQI